MPISRAIVLQQCGQCRRAGRMKERLIRAHTTRRKEYLVKANYGLPWWPLAQEVADPDTVLIPFVDEIVPAVSLECCQPVVYSLPFIVSLVAAPPLIFWAVAMAMSTCIYIYPGDNVVHTKFGSANKRYCNCALPPIPLLCTGGFGPRHGAHPLRGRDRAGRLPRGGHRAHRPAGGAARAGTAKAARTGRDPGLPARRGRVVGRANAGSGGRDPFVMDRRISASNHALVGRGCWVFRRGKLIIIGPHAQVGDVIRGYLPAAGESSAARMRAAEDGIPL